MATRPKTMEDEISKLKEAFRVAQTTEELLTLLSEIEKVGAFHNLELGIAFFRIAFELHHQDHNHQKALSFATRALNILDNPCYGFLKSQPFVFATLLQLLGLIHISLKRFNDSLSYLDRANQIVVRLMDEEGLSVAIVWPVLEVVQVMIIRAYAKLLNFKEALVFCFKSLDIHEKWEGPNNVVAGRHRLFLGNLYLKLEEHEKALEQNALAQGIFKDLDLKSDLSRCELNGANVLIAMGRYDEAVGTLKNVVQQTDDNDEEEWETHALALIALAKACCNQENFVDCKSYLLDSLGILDQREDKSPVDVADAYSKICEQYETMHEFETAISLLKRTLGLLEMLPHEQHSIGKVSAKMGKLLLLAGEVEEAITYLESAAKSLEYSSGPKNIQVAYNYNNMGTAYLKLGKPQSAVQMFAAAKDIMDVSLASDHVDTIVACQNLSKAYGEMKSYGLAIDFQQQVISAWESRGASGEDKLREAHHFLEELKKNALDFNANEPPVKTLP